VAVARAAVPADARCGGGCAVARHAAGDAHTFLRARSRRAGATVGLDEGTPL
jgi:hypothetical protein